ncbi:MAG: tRNA (adenosine(37)-N6)-threonylcarbamoyltransferase complex ATPase subunit type 1 TsaE [Betaproteobacteria bacterium AqS2]|uniref:tRNA threonylcarbamoyladenosine biosynthesis protein TsaE n=1 Tax=Candidatus Amphirhobacter heronislandensis TaxID=1732024 RepID=A0A930UBM4_9GAMM|nr:tRNA (adenosine(37)-N6)-threonylcarbamoyltransferase complex ATPase subunit type 1 TsaE [Betaproteobacteria bacterium AqS2]
MTAATAQDEIKLPTEAATLELGGRLAPLLPRPGMVHLRGELGAGKTTLARGILRALGVAAEVVSPTFTLLETYNSDGLMFAHIDLFQEWHEAGLAEALDASDLCLVEWPEKAAGLGTPDIDVALRDAPAGGRVAVLAAGTAAGAACLARL